MTHRCLVMTEDLIKKLETSPTDPRRLVERVAASGSRPVVAIAAAAIDRWRRDDPQSWRLVLDWLVSRGVKIVAV